MDDNFKAILDSLPKKRQRSKLEPYTELINQLRRRGHTYREITCILAEKCDLVVASSTIVRFVAACSKARRKRSKHHESRIARNTGGESIKVNLSSTAPDDDVWKRIEALKKRSAKSVRPSKQFEYDPDQPLHLAQRPGRKKTS
jgi:G:T-mismatch repair DNA endonuclease (very short patch repair protein)